MKKKRKISDIYLFATNKKSTYTKNQKKRDNKLNHSNISIIYYILGISKT